jgi:acetyltransferase-like isoleucine patch superfamily enzyme
MTGARSLAHDWFPRPLPGNVVIGERSWLYSTFAFLHYRSLRPCGVRIGDDTGVYVGTFFDLGPDGEVEIGNYCSVVGATISTNRSVVIGDYTFLAHDVVLADSTAAVPGGNGTGPGITLGPNTWVGTRAVLLAGARVGEGAVVGAAAVVSGDVPTYSIVAGNPARVVGTVRRSDNRGGRA